jgi:predicted MFS family arabinose efflux permease
MFSVAFPLFASDRGYDARQIGWLVGAASLSLFIFGVPITTLGSRGHARSLLVAGTLVSAAGQLMLLATTGTSFALSFAGALLSGMVSATFWILGDPLLAATTPSHRRAHVFALKFSLVTAGFAIGGGLGGWIPAALVKATGLGRSEALAATMLVVAALDLAQALVYGTVPDMPQRQPHRPGASRLASRSLTLDRRVWAVLFLLATPEIGMALGHNSIRPFLALYFQDRHNLSSGAIGTTMFILALAGGVGALFVPGFAGRLGNLRTIGMFRLIGAALIVLCFSGVGALVVIALMLGYYAIVDGTEATFVTEAMERLPAEQRTPFSGLYAMLWSAASFFAAALSGRLQDDAGFGAAFSIGVVGYLLSVAWIIGVFPRLPTIAASAVPTAAHEHASETAC